MEVRPADIVLYLWRNDRTVVIGANQNPWTECAVDALRADGGHLARRRTGGGAVYHDLGNVNFSFIARPPFYDVRRQLGVIARALAPFGLAAEISGRNDMTTGGRKFSGNAFLKTKDACLHHGTILIRTDAAAMTKYLTPAKEKLARKGVASVRSRVVNLAELNPAITAEALVPEIERAFPEEYGIRSPEGPEGSRRSEEDCFRILAAEPRTKELAAKYAGEAWLYAKWRAAAAMDARARVMTAFGLCDVSARIADGRIAAAAVASDALDPDRIAALEHALVGRAATPQTLAGVFTDLSGARQ